MSTWRARANPVSPEQRPASSCPRRRRILRYLRRMIARVRWLLLGLAVVVLVVHSLAYNFVTDDAYISFVYSRNLAEHGELTFNLAQPVEGYTNFLWTFVL